MHSVRQDLLDKIIELNAQDNHPAYELSAFDKKLLSIYAEMYKTRYGKV